MKRWNPNLARKLREAAKLSRRDVIARAGIPYNTLTSYESIAATKRRSPGSATVVMLAELYKCDPGAFFDDVKRELLVGVELRIVGPDVPDDIRQDAERYQTQLNERYTQHRRATARPLSPRPSPGR